MGLTHKILDGVDVRGLCEVAASIILLENDFFSHQIHSRFDSKNLMNTLSYDLPILQGFQKTKNNSYGSKRINYLSDGLFFLHFLCWILNHLSMGQRTE